LESPEEAILEVRRVVKGCADCGCGIEGKWTSSILWPSLTRKPFSHYR